MSTSIDEKQSTSPADDGRSPGRPTPAWQTVALREISVKLRDKNFLTSLVVTLLMVAGSFGLQIWLAGKTDTTKVAVVTGQSSPGGSASELVSAAQKTAKDDGQKVEYRTEPKGSEQQARDAVNDKSVDVAMVRHGDGWQLVGRGDVDSDFTKYVTQAVRERTLAANAQASGVDLQKLGAGTTVSTAVLEDDGNRAGVAQVTTLIFAILFYLVALLFGLPIAQSVVEEKQSRIVEILASAVPLRQLLAGKIIGNAVLAIAQVTLLAAVALIGLSQTKWSDLVGTFAGASGWFIVFFIAGSFVVACMFAVAGALASRSEDVQSTAQPITMLVLVVFMLGFVLKGTALKVASFVPVVSIVAMPGRVVRGEAQWWEPVVSLVLAVVAAGFITRVATRLYTRSVMQTGGRLTYRQAFRLKG